MNDTDTDIASAVEVKIAIVQPEGRLAALKQGISAFIAGVTNPMSLLSTFVFMMSVAFLCVGHFMYNTTYEKGMPQDMPQYHDIAVVFEYFGSCIVLGIAYAIGYGSYASNQTNFDGGYVSARAVMRGIALLTSISFVVVGYEILSLGWWYERALGLLCLAGMPIIMTGFAIVYGMFANSSGDMLPAGSYRRGSGRRTMLLMTLMTMASSVYYIYVSALSKDSTTIWLSMLYALGSFMLCFIVILAFQKNVSVENDRGFHAG